MKWLVYDYEGKVTVVEARSFYFKGGHLVFTKHTDSIWDSVAAFAKGDWSRVEKYKEQPC